MVQNKTSNKRKVLMGIQVGKYIMRDGRIAIVQEILRDRLPYPVRGVIDAIKCFWDADGYFHASTSEHSYDLVEHCLDCAVAGTAEVIQKAEGVLPDNTTSYTIGLPTGHSLNIRSRRPSDRDEIARVAMVALIRNGWKSPAKEAVRIADDLIAELAK